MRILILGAGGTGGYFGARLMEAGADVSFLVRARRAAQLAADGLRMLSPLGDVHVPVRAIQDAAAHDPYDLVLLSCKAYDLDSALDSIAPAVGPASAVLPLLNGMAHYRALDARFGDERVLGGLCHLAVTLDLNGTVRHLNRLHALTFGERGGGRSVRCDAVDKVFSRMKVNVRYSENVLLDAWDKWVMLATLAGMTCLMRASVGEIVATTHGRELTEAMLAECAQVAARSGYRVSDERLERSRALLTEAGSSFTASMLRDMERGGPTEGEQILGDMTQRGRQFDVATPLLDAAYTHVQVYEARRHAAGS